MSMSWLGRSLVTLLPIALLLTGGMQLMSWAEQPGQFPLRVVEIQSPLKWTSKEAIIDITTTYLDKGFFGLQVYDLQEKLSTLPWLASVSVRRIWPDRVVITLKEQTPLARFGETAVLNSEGQLFYPEPDSIPEKLPQFNGPYYATKEMVQQYFATLEMIGPLGLSLTELTFSNEGSVRMKLDNGLEVILGKTAFVERLNRFVLIYPKQLEKDILKIATVDCRYTNGLAIAWKTAESTGIATTAESTGVATTAETSLATKLSEITKTAEKAAAAEKTKP